MALAILIVDDSVVMRTMIRRTLTAGGIAVDRIGEAGNGQEALDAIASDRWDLVIADLNMPVMDGEAMLERIRAHPLTRRLPVIVVSTESSETRVEALRRLDAAFVHKPFTPALLAGEILRLTGAPDGHLAPVATAHGGDFDF